MAHLVPDIDGNGTWRGGFLALNERGKQVATGHLEADIFEGAGGEQITSVRFVADVPVAPQTATAVPPATS